MTKIEINRYFASPKAFYKYCANKLKDHEGWIPESFEFFEEPFKELLDTQGQIQEKK